MGAYIELNAGVFPICKLGTTSWDIISRILENVAVEQLVIDSDLGQKGNGSPVVGFYDFITVLMKDLHVTEQQINKMLKETPAYLLGI